MESLFNDDDIFDDEFNNNLSDILIGRDVDKILDKLMNGFTVSDDDLELVCTPLFQYKVADYKELHDLIYNKIKPLLFKDDIHEFNLNWINICNVNKLDYLLLFKPLIGDKYPIFWHVEKLNTVHITRMKLVFGNLILICDLSKWNTENALDMTEMFNNCEIFNLDISNWNVSNVECMDNMFSLCKKFNHPILKWDMNKVKSFKNMLFQCCSFDLDFSCIDLRKYSMDNIVF